MAYLQFRSILARLRQVDMQDLTEAGAIDENWGTRGASHRDQPRDFLNNPFTEFLRMPQATDERLFRFLEEKKVRNFPAFLFLLLLAWAISVGPVLIFAAER